MMVKLVERCVQRDAAAGISVVGWQGSQDPESPWSPSR
jgi:hypothetical protein